MDVRDAVEGDAERLAELSDSPTDVMRNLVHDRTVRVAQSEGGQAEGGGENGSESRDDVRGFVSFDAQERTVHVTQAAGSVAALSRLLEEPRRFAANEGMDVEWLVSSDDDHLRDAAEAAGFEDAGAGPRFGGTPTVRYRLDPAAGSGGSG
jgi:hypothetical protein